MASINPKLRRHLREQLAEAISKYGGINPSELSFFFKDMGDSQLLISLGHDSSSVGQPYDPYLYNLEIDELKIQAYLALTKLGMESKCYLRLVEDIGEQAENALALLKEKARKPDLEIGNLESVLSDNKKFLGLMFGYKEEFGNRQNYYPTDYSCSNHSELMSMIAEAISKVGIQSPFEPDYYQEELSAKLKL